MEELNVIEDHKVLTSRVHGNRRIHQMQKIEPWQLSFRITSFYLQALCLV